MIHVATICLVGAMVAFGIIVHDMGLPNGKSEWTVYIWMSLVTWPILISLTILDLIQGRR